MTSNPPAADTSVKEGDVVEVGQGSYTVADTDKKEVAYKAPAKADVTSVTVPNTVKITENGAEVTYKVTAISDNAFANQKKLKSVTIGKGVTSIGKNAFKGCKNLKKIAVKSTSLKKVGKNALKGIHKKAVITCNKKKVKAYKKLFNAKTGFKKTMKVKKG